MTPLPPEQFTRIFPERYCPGKEERAVNGGIEVTLRKPANYKNTG
jgi:hypothetical protein